MSDGSRAAEPRPQDVAGGLISDGVPGEAQTVFRNTKLQVGAEVVSKIAMLAFYAVMARELGESGFGVFTFAISIVALIEIAGIGADLATTRAVARSRAEVEGYFWNSVLIKVVAGAAGTALILAFVLATGYSNEVWAAVAVMSAAKLVELLALSVYAVFRGVEDARPVAVSFVIQRLTTAILGCGALLWLGAGIIGVTLVYLGGAVAALAYALAKLGAHQLRPRISLSSAAARDLFTRSIPLGAAGVFGTLVSRLDAVILSLMTNNAVVGLYGAAYRLFEGSAFLSYSFGIALFPVLARARLSEGDPASRRMFEIACKAVTLVMVPVGMTMALFAPVFVEPIYGSGFAEAASTTRILGLASAALGLFMLGCYALAAEDRERALFRTMVGLAALNLALNLLLIPSLLEDGSAIAMSATIAAGAAVTIAIVSPDRRLRLMRIGASASVGAVAMTAVWWAAGESPIAMIASLTGYTLTALGAERGLYASDLRALLRAARSPGRNAAGSEGYTAARDSDALRG